MKTHATRLVAFLSESHKGFVTVTCRRIVFIFSLVALFATAVFGQNGIQLEPTKAGPTKGVNFLNTSMLVPGPAKLTTYCPWLDKALDLEGFTPANGWTFTWAGAADSSFVKRDVQIYKYFAWVVQIAIVPRQMKACH